MDEFKITHRIPVRFRDIDMLGHVNNAVYLTYLEESRLHYYKELSMNLPSSDPSFILAGVEIAYRSPAFLGETLEVGLGVRELKSSSFRFHFRITEVESGRLVADGKLVQVCYDYGTGKKAEMPLELRERLCDFEGLDRCWPEGKGPE